MNIGPQPNGELPALGVERLKDMGEWLKIYGETVFGTRGGVVTPRDWGVTTQKDNVLYAHIFNLQDKALFIPYSGSKLKSAVCFADKTSVKFVQDKDGILLKFNEIPNSTDEVIALTFTDTIK
jgi:alpha-L-fucosidase